MVRRFFHMVRRFWRHFWTRSTAIIILVFLFSLAVAFTVIGIQVKLLSNVATVVLAVINAITATIALIIPLSRKNEARRKIQRAMNQYVILQSLKAESSQKNRVINRMRELAPDALYPQEEIADYLHSTDVGERFAALASVQWQWQNRKAHEEMEFLRLKKIPSPPKHPDKGYFPQLLEMLCDSYDEFENYHATVAMWSMLDSLEPEDRQKLYNRVLDKNECPLPHRCNEWKKFTDSLQEKRRQLGN